MAALTKVGEIIRCGWLRYLPQDDEEAYDELIHRAATQKKRGSVADAVAKFEASTKAETSLAKQKKDQEDDEDEDLPLDATCTQKAISGATVFFGLFGSGSQSADTNSASQNGSSRTSFRAAPSNEPTCRVCHKKIFPTDESTSCRNNTYHTGCFRCSQCNAKLKNHPDEEHRELPETKEMFLQCRQCKIDTEQKCKPRQLSRKAGSKIVVEDSEQGDIEQVVDAIGDDLEDALYGMIPRCATCGGDFLTYKGEISIVGSLKYHNECFLTGKPVVGTVSLTLEPLQAAKYLPESIILKLSSNESCRVISSLFFVWKDREKKLRSMRTDTTQRSDHLTVTFDLDENARANPNYKGVKNSPSKTSAPLMKCEKGDHSDLTLELIGGDQIAPQPPRLVEPVTVIPGYQRASPYLKATIGYSKYNLDHTMILTIPCNLSGNVLELLGATLTVIIQEPAL
ncbi:expressed unknown protein [Seminavis robusta]|uniref:LIM zinc-binding domain-containing protein n=1 Tax=Seminavis robusta TaxID=568900 RepID=A0A9N8HM01_9STRA|nr:expressed unknown protein [Seminavis robusta]|eukprot:Sro712_g191420.1 n/a (455) ;mRNA; f:41025-42389